ncbi:MAG TPA: methyltransferase domain-containing protein [Chthonomonadaceae bacterium]|nr:methyltransferase domain-containing protein [Chthonomonadaceae bacterium]
MRSLLDWDTPARRDEPEWIDDPSRPYADLRASMTDVQRINRFLGGAPVVLQQAKRWLRAARSDPKGAVRPVTFLDVATGSGDLPKAILALARREEVPVRIIGLDFSAPILRFAREEVGAEPAIRLVRGDAFRLPFAAASIDYVLCSLAFHHFSFEGSVAALKEMERVARCGWLVNDLRRAWSAWALIRILSALTGMNRLTRHDGPASVLRAYSLPEYRAMPEALGLRLEQDVHLRRHLFYRVALIREKSDLFPEKTFG